MTGRMIIGFGAVVVVITALGLQAGPRDTQRNFATPQEAIQAVVDASKRNDTAALRQIFGPENKDIVESGDPAEDTRDREVFARLAQEKLEVNIDPVNTDRATFSIGQESWPFPVPLTRKAGRWEFDSSKGSRTEYRCTRQADQQLQS
jgi:hypothetical protein